MMFVIDLSYVFLHVDNQCDYQYISVEQVTHGDV